MWRNPPSSVRREARAVLALAWPLALTNLSQHLLTLTNAVILGWHATESLAASTLAANLYWVMMAPSLGTAFAASAILAQARGRGRLPGGAGRGWVREMRRGARASLLACLLLLAPSLAVLWHGDAVLRALGQEPHLAALAGEYLRAMMWGLVPLSVYFVLRGFLAAMERPGPALWVAGAAIGLNALLCWLLVFGAFGWPGLGMQGAGIASLCADLFMGLGLLAVVTRDRALGRFRLLGRFWRWDAARIAEVWRVGLPISGTMLLEIGVFTAAALAMGRFGAVAVAAHAIALQVAATTFMVPMGIGQAATARVGLLAGAGDAAGARRAGWVAVGLGAGFMALAALGLVLGAPRLAWGFLDARDADAAAAAALGAVLLTVAGVFQLADGVQAVAAGALRGLKDTRVPMLLAALGYWGLGMPVGVGLAIGAGVGPPGIWLGLAAGLAVVAGLMLRRWARLSARPLPSAA